MSRPPAAPGPSGPRPEAIPARPGSLVLVATPIGNLGDLSSRALATLAAADVLYCEDTRHSRKLLSHAGISGVPLRSLHEHNEVDRIPGIVEAVRRGDVVAVVSDAGMPGISDPGSRVVAAVAGAGLTVSVVPGPSAAVAALVVSGFPTDRFCFEGFLPRTGRDRRSRLGAIAAEPRTVVLFEAPGRTSATLGDLAAACGSDRPVAVVRELTKRYEQVWRGTLAGAAEWAEASPVRGEVVVVLAGAPAAVAGAVDDAVLEAALRTRFDQGERTRGAVDAVAAEFGVGRRHVYDLAVALLRVPPSSGP